MREPWGEAENAEGGKDLRTRCFSAGDQGR